MVKTLTLPVHRWRQGMESWRAATLPTAASIQRKADDGEATAADAAVLYLEAVISAASEATADEIDAELSGSSRSFQKRQWPLFLRASPRRTRESCPWPR